MQAIELRMATVAYAKLKDDLIAATGLAEDDECLADSLEGISDLNEIIIKALREAKRAEAMADAMGAIIAANQERKARYVTTSGNIRNAVAQAMQDAGLNKVTAPDMTISHRAGKAAPKVVDAAALPEWAKVEKIVVSADMAAIKEAFETDRDGFSCPGVEVTAAHPILTVRTR